MKSTQKKLEKITSETPSRWDEILNEVSHKKNYSDKSFSIATHINLLMIEQKMKKRDLAEKMCVSPQQISKWLKGDCNFNLETICKFEEVLNTTLISIPQQNYSFDQIHNKSQMTKPIKNTMKCNEQWDNSNNNFTNNVA